MKTAYINNSNIQSYFSRYVVAYGLEFYCLSLAKLLSLQVKHICNALPAMRLHCARLLMARELDLNALTACFGLHFSLSTHKNCTRACTRIGRRLLWQLYWHGCYDLSRSVFVRFRTWMPLAKCDTLLHVPICHQLRHIKQVLCCRRHVCQYITRFVSRS